MGGVASSLIILISPSFINLSKPVCKFIPKDIAIILFVTIIIVISKLLSSINQDILWSTGGDFNEKEKNISGNLPILILCAIILCMVISIPFYFIVYVIFIIWAIISVYLGRNKSSKKINN